MRFGAKLDTKQRTGSNGRIHSERSTQKDTNPSRTEISAKQIKEQKEYYDKINETLHKLNSSKNLQEEPTISLTALNPSEEPGPPISEETGSVIRHKPKDAGSTKKNNDVLLNLFNEFGLNLNDKENVDTSNTGGSTMVHRDMREVAERLFRKNTLTIISEETLRQLTEKELDERRSTQQVLFQIDASQKKSKYQVSIEKFGNENFSVLVNYLDPSLNCSLEKELQHNDPRDPEGSKSELPKKLFVVKKKLFDEKVKSLLEKSKNTEHRHAQPRLGADDPRRVLFSKRPSAPKGPKYVVDMLSRVQSSKGIQAPETTGQNVFFKLACGLFYEGTVKFGRVHGKGMLLLECVDVSTVEFGQGNNKVLYQGEFADNEVNGKGTLWFQGGSKFVGNFQSGKAHGSGKIIENDGKVSVQGVWLNGVLY